MKNIHYIFWADAIMRIRKFHPHKKDWKASIYFLNSWIHGLNLVIICLWLKYFSVIDVSLPQINIFPGTLIDKFLSFSVVFALPFLILNYFLIFHKNRYKMIVEKHHLINGNYAMPYLMVVTLGAFFSVILYSIFTK